VADSSERRDQPRKLLAGGAIKVKLALGSAAVLTVGAWLAPRASPTELSAPQERAAPLLEEQVQLRQASQPFLGVQDVAASVLEHSVAIVLPPSPAVPSRNDYSESGGGTMPVSGFGVFVSDSHVLTHSVALDGHSSAEVSGNARKIPARVVTYEPSTGLVLLEVEPLPRPISATLATEAPMPGALAVAVGRSEERDLAVPLFVTSVERDRYAISAISSDLFPGMPVFNLSGELLAITAPDRQHVQAIPVREAAARMVARASMGERRSSFGLGFQVATGRLVDAFGREGVIVSEVIPGGPADTADVQVGDVLLAVGDARIDSADTATRVLSTATIGTAMTLRLRRNARSLDVSATPAMAYDIAALARADADAPLAPEARVLFPAAVLEKAAIPPSARVISVNGRRVTSRVQVQRDLRLAREAVPVLLRYGRSQFFVAVEPIP
jgi:S1-C subfamily serine protease